MDCIEFSANKDGSINIERKIAGIVTDRFNAPKHIGFFTCKRKDAWIGKAIGYLMQPSAGIVIEVPAILLLEPSQAEQLEILEEELQDAKRELCELEDILPEYEKMKHLLSANNRHIEQLEESTNESSI